MASLQVLKFLGPYGGTENSIPDGPPAASMLIAAGNNGTVFGGDGKPVICLISPVGGQVTITWPGGVAEVLTAPRACALRGEAIGVA